MRKIIHCNASKFHIYLFIAFAPTDAKLTSQYMVLDHMNAHYKKLSKAKCKYVYCYYDNMNERKALAGSRAFNFGAKSMFY